MQTLGKGFSTTCHKFRDDPIIGVGVYRGQTYKQTNKQTYILFYIYRLAGLRPTTLPGFPVRCSLSVVCRVYAGARFLRDLFPSKSLVSDQTLSLLFMIRRHAHRVVRRFQNDGNLREAVLVRGSKYGQVYLGITSTRSEKCR